VSESFPLEVRSVAIACFFSAGTLLGGFAGPTLFGYLVETKDRSMLFIGYMIGCGLMLTGGIVGGLMGTKGERQMLEEITDPLTKAKSEVSDRPFLEEMEGGEDVFKLS